MSTSRPWFLYVLECRGGSLYTGVALDVARRFSEHQRGRGARYTRSHPPERVLLTIEFPDKSAALKAEHAFKALPVNAKRALVARHGS
ncbi:GIY-YIG nuclease family protein [Crenobacter sp. HX-7-9]|uniref:GIY-YIG nuclease family protein n=1 Tax=Crenobacter caeni TaxID=2705474 RepID=A0A6B2KMI4_9NEIS|nr:GIY-YIG nuclease family protein [Crenobacter caeni]